jgi:glutathionylspermidine synthase
MIDAVRAEEYGAFAKSILASGIISDPWIDGQPRFRREPLVLPVRDAEALAEVGRAIGELYEEASQICWDEPALLDDFFALTPVQKAMFQASRPLWHGIARADVFRTSDGGWVVAELNCDTPTGEPEAVVLGDIARGERPELIDPNADLGDHFVAMVERMVTALVSPSAERTAGFIYPTEFSEDLSLVRLYKKWLEERGWRVVLGSPYNLTRAAGDATARVFAEPVSLIVRHYKTDWWSERASAWSDEELLDTAPLLEPLEIALGAQAQARTAIVNPFGSVLAQNKRTMAFFWEHIHRFSLKSQERIRDLVPHSARLEALHPEQVTSQREAWVLKSDYGAEGGEVVIGRHVTQEEWLRACELARRGRWIAQRYFEAETDAAGQVVNYGVFLVAGEPAGLYARVHSGATDEYALSTPVLIDPRA